MYNITVQNTFYLFIAVLIGLVCALTFSYYFPSLSTIKAIVAAGENYDGPSLLPFHLATILCLSLGFILRLIRTHPFLQSLGLIFSVVGQYFLFLVLFPMREHYGASVYSFNIITAGFFYVVGGSLLNRILASTLAIGFALVMTHQLWNTLSALIPLLAWLNIGLWLFVVFSPEHRLQNWLLPVAWGLTFILSASIIILEFIDPSGMLLGHIYIKGGQIILLLTGFALPMLSFYICAQKKDIPMHPLIWGACFTPITILTLLYFMNLHVALAFSWVIIGFSLRDKILLLYGLVAMAIFQGFFYYQLPLTFFDKGVVLVLSGMILITMQQLIYHVVPNFARPFPEPEIAEEPQAEPTMREQLSALFNNPYLFRRSAAKAAASTEPSTEPASSDTTTSSQTEPPHPESGTSTTPPSETTP